MTEIETTLSDVQLFIESLKKDLPEVFSKDAPEQNSDGKILFTGGLYDAVIEINPDAEPKVTFDDGKFTVTMKSESDDAGALAEAWLREEAGRVIKERTAALAQKMGVEYNAVFIKDQRTMWGSCSDKKNLNFSYRLIKTPAVIMDYLIVHELAHLLHMNHGQEYWALVSSFCPDYNQHRKWLNGNRAHVMADTKIDYKQPAAVEAEPRYEQN